MSRSYAGLIATISICAVGACSKGGANAAGHSEAAQAGGSSANAGAQFMNGGGTACTKYLTPELVTKIIGGPTRPAKTLSPQSCSITRTDDAGDITITLTNATPESFKAYQQYLSNPQPLQGVGDQAVQSLIGITSIKKPNMGCDIDAGGAPGSAKMDRAALGKELGDICNKIYADAR